MLQAAVLDGVAFDSFPRFIRMGLPAPEVDIGRREGVFQGLS